MPAWVKAACSLPDPRTDFRVADFAEKDLPGIGVGNAIAVPQGIDAHRDGQEQFVHTIRCPDGFFALQAVHDGEDSGLFPHQRAQIVQGIPEMVVLKGDHDQVRGGYVVFRPHDRD